MMNKLFVAVACAIALVGCGDSVSGKYEGTWEDRGLTYKIESRGDHYYVHQHSTSTGDFSFIAKEDADGFLIDPDNGKRFLKWQDGNTVTNASGERPLKKK